MALEIARQSVGGTGKAIRTWAIAGYYVDVRDVSSIILIAQITATSTSATVANSFHDVSLSSRESYVRKCIYIRVKLSLGVRFTILLCFPSSLRFPMGVSYPITSNSSIEFRYCVTRFLHRCQPKEITYPEITFNVNETRSNGKQWLSTKFIIASKGPSVISRY